MIPRGFVLTGALAWASAAGALPAMPPQLSPEGESAYREFIEATDHKAFAIASGGAWGWTAGEFSPKAAEDKALAICRAQTRQRCVSYALDDRIVFDVAAWSRSWGPYPDAAKARHAKPGREIGQHMFDLAFRDAQGRTMRLSSLQGRVVVLHFWGSWCPPCRRELPDMAALRESLADRSDIAFVLLQVREPFEVSRRWATGQNVDMPLHDSGSSGDEDATFRLGSGSVIKDREIASRFPTTYVLDKRGVVVFAHVGPVHGWPRYQALLIDAAERSGR